MQRTRHTRVQEQVAQEKPLETSQRFHVLTLDDHLVMRDQPSDKAINAILIGKYVFDASA